MSGFKKATKKSAKLRLALVGPAGSGKTYTALALAEHFGKRVAVIDTERQSASLYADKFSFDVMELVEPEPEAYVEALREANNAGYDVVIVDSLSHAWQALLDRVDRLGEGKYRGNSFRAWGDEAVTPVQRSLVDALLTFPGHLIATMRTKTTYEVVENERGKKEPRKIGLAPVQREGVDYEFSIVLDMAAGGTASVSKTRCAEIEGKAWRRPGKDLALTLMRWLGSGDVAEQRPAPAAVAPSPVPEVKADPEPETIGMLSRSKPKADQEPEPIPPSPRDKYAERRAALKARMDVLEAAPLTDSEVSHLRYMVEHLQVMTPSVLDRTERRLGEIEGRLKSLDSAEQPDELAELGL